jgi:hypothetical protein
MLKDSDVLWITNDNGELGVRIGDQCFFLYKGESLVYGEAAHDDGTPMMIRPVSKREFGECCHAMDMDALREVPHEFHRFIRDKKTTLADGGEWAQMPIQSPKAHGEGEG